MSLQCYFLRPEIKALATGPLVYGYLKKFEVIIIILNIGLRVPLFQISKKVLIKYLISHLGGNW